MNVKELLQRDFVCLDGSMGAVVMGMGYPADDILKLNLDAPGVIEKIQKGYFEAGSDMVFTNTFDLSAAKAQRYGVSIGELVNAAIDIADKAREGMNDKFVALDLSPSGMEEEEAYGHYITLIEAGNDRTDLIVVETLTSLSDLRACIKAVKAASSLPLFSSISVRENGRTWFGDRLEDYIDTVNGSDILCAGINCTLDPAAMLPMALKLKEGCDMAVYAKPNRGQPVKTAEGTSYDMSAEEFSEGIMEIYRRGIRVLGGCCGSDAECIGMINRKIRG